MKCIFRFLFISLFFFLSHINSYCQFKIEAYKSSKKAGAVKQKGDSDIKTFADGLVLRTVTDRSTYFENGLVCVKWELLYPNLPNLSVGYKVTSFHIPKLPDFVVEQTLNPTESDSLNVYRLSHNGKPYMAKTLLCFYISPLMFSGTASIGEGDITLQLYNKSGGYIGLPKTIKSNGVTFNVASLKSKPKNFSNGIGQFSIETRLLPNTNMFVGQSSTLRVTIKGTGNLKQLVAPKIVLPDSFEYYALTPKYNINYNYTECSGSCIFDYVIIPHNVASYVIPSVKFSFYSLNKKRFEDIASSAIHINVHPKIVQKNEQLLESHKKVQNIQSNTNTQPSLPLYLIFAAFIIVLLGVYSIYRRNSNKENCEVKSAYQNAEVQIMDLVTSNDISFVYSQSSKILKNYFFDTYGEPLLCDRYSDFTDICKSCGLAESYIKSLFDFLKECDNYCYSPCQDSNKTASSISGKARLLLEQLKH